MALYTWSMGFLAFYVSLVFLIASSCFTKFFLIAYIVKYSGLYLLEYYSSYVGIIILMHSFEITFKSNWYLSTSVSPVERNLRVHFFGESKNRFVISDHTDSSLPKNRRSEKGSFTMTTACPRTPRGKKKTTNWSSRRRQEEKAT